MRRSSAAAATWRFTSGVAAATTNQAPSRSLGANSRCNTITPPNDRRAGPISGATTVTYAPARVSSPSLAAATPPPPTSRTLRPSSFRKTGNSTWSLIIFSSDGKSRGPGPLIRPGHSAFCLGTTFALSWNRLHAIRQRDVHPGFTSRAFGAGLAAGRAHAQDGVLDHQPLLARDDDLRPARGAALLVNGIVSPAMSVRWYSAR